MRDGYRLRVQGLDGLSHVIEGFRGDALRILARAYGRLVAVEAARRVDMHRAGADRRPDGDSPIADACEHVRAGFAAGTVDLDCTVRFHVVGTVVLATFASGNGAYRKAFEGRREVVPWGWEAGAERPKTVTENNWEARERYWTAAAPKEGLLQGLGLSLVDGMPPVIGWGGVRRYLPTREERARSLAAAIAGPGASDVAEARRRALAAVTADLSREDLLTYGAAAPNPAARAPKPDMPVRRDSAGPVTIDHADIVEASDGRVFVAVPFAGLEADSRVFMQVAENALTIVQNSVHFGTVAGVPRVAADLLRDCKHAILVEVDAGDRLLRARHVAIVSDMSLHQTFDRSHGRLRVRDGARQRGDREIRRWESGRPDKTS